MGGTQSRATFGANVAGSSAYCSTQTMFAAVEQVISP